MSKRLKTNVYKATTKDNQRKVLLNHGFPVNVGQYKDMESIADKVDIGYVFGGAKDLNKASSQIDRKLSKYQKKQEKLKDQLALCGEVINNLGEVKKEIEAIQPTEARVENFSLKK